MGRQTRVNRVVSRRVKCFYLAIGCVQFQLLLPIWQLQSYSIHSVADPIMSIIILAPSKQQPGTNLSSVCPLIDEIAWHVRGPIWRAMDQLPNRPKGKEGPGECFGNITNRDFFLTCNTLGKQKKRLLVQRHHLHQASGWLSRKRQVDRCKGCLRKRLRIALHQLRLVADGPRRMLTGPEELLGVGNLADCKQIKAAPSLLLPRDQ